MSCILTRVYRLRPRSRIFNHKTLLTRCHREHVGAEAAEHVRDALAERIGEGALLERRQLVGDEARHLSQLTESVAHVDAGGVDVVGSVCADADGKHTNIDLLTIT